MLEWVAENLWSIFGFVAASLAQAYYFLRKIDRMELRLEVVEKNQDESWKKIEDRLDRMEGKLDAFILSQTRHSPR